MKVFTFSSHHIELSKKGKLDSNELMYEETKPEASPVNDMICHESMPKPHRRPDVVTHPQLVNDKLYTEPVDSVAREQLFFETATRIVQDLICQDSIRVRNKTNKVDSFQCEQFLDRWHHSVINH